jgi:adenine phosphoribosyltransferase
MTAQPDSQSGNDTKLAEIARYIRELPDFPKPGILFYDITPLLANARAFKNTIDLLAERVAPRAPEAIIGIESRGFIFGGALAARLGIGFLPIRKPGKLPYKTTRVEYQLEYGQDALEMHSDAVTSGTRVCICDDLLATGGTAAAAAQLVERMGGRVTSFAFAIELDHLGGRKRLAPHPVEALLHFDR